MTLNEFISKYSGKTIGYPGDSYKGECLSLVKQYMKEMFSFNPPASGCNGARCYWSIFPDPLSKYFTKVPNTPTGVPKSGDIVIWNEKAGGGYGHIAIVTEASVNSFKSFDQNWGGRHAHIVTHDYSNVYGWLTPIKSEQGGGQMNIDPKIFEELVGKSTKYDEFVKAGFSNPTAIKQKIDNLEKDKKNLEKDKKELEGKLNDAALYAGKLETDLEKSQSAVSTLETDKKELQGTIKQRDERIKVLEAENERLSNAMDAEISTDYQTNEDENQQEEVAGSLFIKVLKSFREWIRSL